MLTAGPTARPRRGIGSLILAAVIAAALLALLVWPVLLAIKTGFVKDGRLSAYWLGRVLFNDTLVDELGGSVLLGCATTLACVLVATPLALIRARCRFRGQGVLGMLLLVPLILPPFVGALSMRRLLGQYGVLNLILSRLSLVDLTAPEGPPDWLGSGFWGVVILQVLHLFPIMYLNASAALANIDPAYAQAARNLGAGPVRTFFRITLPLLRPGLFAGGTIIFIWSFTDIGTPVILHLDTVAAVRVFRELVQAEVNPRTFSLVFIVLAASVTLYVAGKFLFGRPIAADSAKASIAAEMRRLSPLGTAAAWLAFGVVIALSLVPHVGVVLTALSDRWVGTILPSRYTLDHLRFVVMRPETFRCVKNSLTYAGISTVIDLAAGCTIAWLIVRARVRGRMLLDALAMLPLAVPGIILAAGYVAMTASGPLQAIGPLGNAAVILIIAYSVRRLPFVVRGICAGLEQIPESLEEAARNLGCSRMGTTFRITAPLIAANLVAAGVLAFSFAMLEVSDSLILAQVQEQYPITKEIYRQATSGSREAPSTASALGVYGMVLLGGTMALASALLGRRLGAIFRA